jgi:hypothetical protein
MDNDLDPKGGATRCLDLGDGVVGGHVFGFGPEFLIGPQIQVGDRDLGPQPGQPLRRQAGRKRETKTRTEIAIEAQREG